MSYVFEALIKGSIDIEALESKIPARDIFDKDGNKVMEEKRQHAPARRFKENLKLELDPENYSHFWKENGHLPNMPSEEEWVKKGGYSLGDLVQRLMEVCQVQAVHIDKMNQRIKALESEREAANIKPFLKLVSK